MRDARQYAPATARNRDPILQVLKRVLPQQSLVLEIASGTGEHGVYFSEQLPSIVWQPTDINPEAIASIEAWRESCSNERLLAPFQIDVQSPQWWDSATIQLKSERSIKVIACINMIHISPWAATEGLFKGAQALLPNDGLLYLYGPYKHNGHHTADSNAQFDTSLRLRNPNWGVRNLEEVVELGQQHGLEFVEAIAMPANNLSVILKHRMIEEGEQGPP